MWAQGHGPDQCFTAMQPTMRQHSQPSLATDIGPGLLNLFTPLVNATGSKPKQHSMQPTLHLRPQGKSHLSCSSLHEENGASRLWGGGCSARLWGVRCQALGGAVPGFEMCIGRLAVGR